MSILTFDSSELEVVRSTYDAAQIYIDHDKITVLTLPEYSPIIDVLSVDRGWLKVVFNDAELLQSVVDYIALLEPYYPEVSILWTDTAKFNSNHAFVQGWRVYAGKTQDELIALFRAAMSKSIE